MRNLIRASLLIAALAAVPSTAAPKIKVMLLDGEQGGPYHAWQETTPYLKKMLDQAGIFDVQVVTAPPAGGDFAHFTPTWQDYAVVVANYDVPDERWSDELKASFEQYIRKGGGLVSVHAADNAFPKWKAYNQMIGIGGWRGRDETSGPLWYYKDGTLVSDNTPGRAGSHGARQAFTIVNRVTTHPVTKGLPAEWMHVPDELYATLRGPGEHMTVLATAFSATSNRGTGRDEPILMALNFGEGRIFHTTLGHDIAALNCVGFIATYQRGVEWAATGKVTQKVPADFPTADKTSTRPEYVPPAGWVSPGGAPRPVPASAPVAPPPPPPATAPPPATEIYLAPMSGAGSALTIGTPVDISNSPEYDNQPSFLPDGSAMLFTSRRDGRQTDIYRYDITTRQVTQLTRTVENEYSALVTPDGKTFSTVRGDKQELWRFDLDGANPRLVYAHQGLIGYHVWIDDRRLAVFVLGASGNPATLQLVDTKAAAAEVIEPNIGQSLLIRPGHKTVSFIGRPPGAPAVVKELDPLTKKTTVITEGLAGSQFLTWLPDGRMLMASGTRIWAWRDGAAGWTEVADFASAGLAKITRLAASPDGTWLALVAEPPLK